MKPGDFATNKPKLDLFDYFDGQSRAWGWFEDRFGTVKRQFVVSIQGRVEGDRLILEEDFVYDDGETDRRVWTIRRTGPNRYLGTAEDVIGQARGETAGNALNWQYTLALPVGDRIWNVRFDDWMFLQRDGVLLNRAVVSKWGLTVGRVAIFFKKEPDVAQFAAE